MNSDRLQLPIAASTAVLAVACAVGLVAAQPAQAQQKAASTPAERGKYLVATSGCHDCHTPLKMGPNGPEPDMGRQLSGHPQGVQLPPVPALPPGPWMVVSSATNTAWAGPWGVSFSANLTPDAESGLGRWTEHDFRQTLRTGRHMGLGRPVLPPMPIPAYSQFSDPDIAAIYAYLRTVPAVKNHVPQPWAPAARTATK